MGEEKGLVSFFTRDAQYELSNSSILIPTKLRRNGLSEIINQLLDLQTRIEFDFIIDGKFLKNSIKHYLDLNSLSTENVTRIEVVEATLPPTNEQKLIHDDWISSIHMKENNMILTGSYDSFVRLWGADGKVIDALSAGKDPIKCVQWIDDSSFLSGDARSNIYGYKVKGNKIVDSFKCIGHLGSIESLAVSENKEIFASASWDKSIRIWSTEMSTETTKVQKSKGKKQRVQETLIKDEKFSLEGSTGAVSGIKFDPESSNTLYSTSWDHSVRIWDLEEQTNVHTMNCEKAGVSLEYSKQSHLIITGHVDGIIRLWDPRSKDGLVVKMKLGSHKNWVSSIANSPKSEYGLASGSYDATVKVWDIRSSIPLHTMSNDDAKVFAVDWKNQFIVSGGEDSKVHVFSTSQ